MRAPDLVRAGWLGVRSADVMVLGAATVSGCWRGIGGMATPGSVPERWDLVVVVVVVVFMALRENM